MNPSSASFLGSGSTLCITVACPMGLFALRTDQSLQETATSLFPCREPPTATTLLDSKKWGAGDLESAPLIFALHQGLGTGIDVTWALEASRPTQLVSRSFTPPRARVYLYMVYHDCLNSIIVRHRRARELLRLSVFVQFRICRPTKRSKPSTSRTEAASYRGKCAGLPTRRHTRVPALAEAQGPIWAHKLRDGLAYDTCYHP